MKLLPIILAASLTGCAASPDYNNYLAAQSKVNELHKPAPLLVLEAHDGQAITGLKRVEVNMPTSAPVIQQARENEWARVVGQAIGVVGVIGGVYATGKAMSDVAGVVGQSSTTGYQYIQAPQTPQANVTTTTNTTLSGSGVLGSGSFSTDSHNTTGSYNPIDNSNQGNPTTYPMVTP